MQRQSQNLPNIGKCNLFKGHLQKIWQGCIKQEPTPLWLTFISGAPKRPRAAPKRPKAPPKRPRAS